MKNRQYTALVLKPAVLVIAFLGISPLDARGESQSKPYLISEPGVQVLACIAHVDSIHVDSTTTGTLTPYIAVSVMNCTVLNSLSEDSTHTFSIMSNAAAFSRREFEGAAWGSIALGSDPNALRISSASWNNIWYKVGDHILLVATRNPESRVTTHEVKYVRFLLASVENLDQKTYNQSGADTLEAAKEYWDRRGKMTTNEVYALIRPRYKQDSESLRQIMTELTRFYIPGKDPQTPSDRSRH